jgi:hypothetical protein
LLNKLTNKQTTIYIMLPLPSNTGDSHYMHLRYPCFHISAVLFQYHEEYSAFISSMPSTSAQEPVTLEEAPVGSSLPTPISFESSKIDDPVSHFMGFQYM